MLYILQVFHMLMFYVSSCGPYVFWGINAPLYFCNFDVILTKVLSGAILDQYHLSMVGNKWKCIKTECKMLQWAASFLCVDSQGLSYKWACSCVCVFIYVFFVCVCFFYLCVFLLVSMQNCHLYTLSPPHNNILTP